MTAAPAEPAPAAPHWADPVAGWLIDEAWRLAGIADVVGGISERFVASGLPLWRLNYIHVALHPELLGASYLWQRGVDGIEVDEAPHGTRATAEYLQSPLRAVFEERETVRRRLTGAKARPDFPILERLRDAGGTDYVALPLEFTAGRLCAVTVATDHPEGFSREDLERMGRLRPLFARTIEVFALREMATTLLDTYVGHDAGARVLAGDIRRGVGETIKAAIWSCDLRDFTSLSDALPRDVLIALLNEFFERVTVGVRQRGGEILKFIGDSVLAVFKTGDERSARAACHAALAASRDALLAVEALNGERQQLGEPPLRFGIALHIGAVMYGNIGAPGRLDFTVVGPAVNLVNRMAGVAGSLGVPIVLSAAFVRRLDEPVHSLGTHALKGVREPKELFTVPEGSATAAMDALWREIVGTPPPGG